jgi:hypothetical protein
LSHRLIAKQGRRKFALFFHYKFSGCPESPASAGLTSQAGGCGSNLQNVKRHYSRRQKPKDPITNLTELVNMDLNLLIKLMHRLVDVEEKQQRFRTCVLICLSRIETMLTEVLGCQLGSILAWPTADDGRIAKQVSPRSSGED